MSKIQEMIERLCPNGVEYKTFGDLCSLVTKQTGFDYSSTIKPSLLRQPTTDSLPYIQTRHFSGKVFSYDTEFYVPKSTWIQYPKLVLNEPVLLISIVGSLGNIGLYPGKIVGFLGGAICIARVKPQFNISYIYYFLSSPDGQKQIRAVTKGSGQATITIEDIRKFEIPIPPLPVQEEIVRVLDTFTELQAELQAELQKRLQQYNYYRDNLLSFEGRTDVEWKELGEVCYYPRERVAGSMLTADTYISTENLLTNKKGKTSALSVPLESCIKYQKQDILIGNIRPYLRKIWLANNDGGTNGDVVLIRRKEDYENVIDSKYLYYVLSSEDFFNYNNSFAKGAKMPRGDKAKIMQYELPIPSLNEQERIASILDRFDTLTNDLTAGLPAEIEKRRQQYEYYRDQLLTFKRAN